MCRKVGVSITRTARPSRSPASIKAWRSSHDSHTDSTNPRILQRKDTLVAINYPLYGRFRALTQAEEAAGLLSHPDIGYRKAWRRFLADQRLTIRGHELLRNGEVIAGGAEP